MDTLYDYLKVQVVRRPDALALSDGARRFTFRQLDEMSGRIAALFPCKPKYVGIVMNHTPEMIASIFAVLRNGAAYVPVEPSFPKERIHYIMKECAVDFIMTESAYSDILEGFPLVKVEKETPLPEAVADTPALRSTASTAYVLYTSGSTGRPKGVMVTNGNVCHYVRAFRQEFHPTEGDIMLQYSVCTFDIFVEEVFTSLLSGAALLLPAAELKNDLQALMRFCDEQRVTIISGFPYLLLDMNKLERVPSSLRLLISGGDVLRESYVSHLLSQVEVYNTYGPSETTVCASYFRCNGEQSLPDGTYPIGKAVKGTRIDILDDNGCHVPTGEMGEICICGGGVADGYVGGRENEAFVTLADGERMYRSGDLGVMRSDGNLLFIHRKDMQVMIRGRRVEPMEVQNILCECKDVEKGVVHAFTDEHGLSYLTAYVVPRDKERFNFKSLRRSMSRFLPPFMIPEFFIKLSSMPLTPNGKVNVGALPEVYKPVQSI